MTRFCFIVNSMDDRRFDWFMQGHRAAFGADAPPVVRVPDAKSMCEGHNRGAAMAPACDWFVFCHDDIRILSPEPLRLLEEAAARVDMFGAAGTRRMVSGNWYDAGRPHTLGQVVARAPGEPGRHELQIFGAASGALQEGAVALDGIFIACRRDLFDKLGGFDAETYRGFVGYDMDFSYRAARAGARVAVHEGLVLLHDSTVADFPEAKVAAWEAAQRSFLAAFGPLDTSGAGERGHRTLPLAAPTDALRHLNLPTAGGGSATPAPATRRGRTHGDFDMRLACFTMFRNEAAIMGPFLDQLGTFFDHVVLLNHGSTDGGPDLVTARGDARFELLQLQASGYPQAELATGFARRIFETVQPDFLFFLDCDEFLPFADRAALEAFLAPYKDRDGLSLRWHHICPENLDGGNIFARPFLRAETPSEYTKVVLGKALAGREGWTVSQGYHAVLSQPGVTLDIAPVTEPALFHIPVQSRAQFRFKVAAGARRIRHDDTLLQDGQGAHWVALDREAARGELDAETMRGIALAYPARPSQPPAARPLDFAFPYVRAPYAETAATTAGQLDGLLLQIDSRSSPAEARSFSVLGQDGSVLLSSHAGSAVTGPKEESREVALATAMPASLFAGTLAEEYEALVAPLFNLPTKMPLTAWSGHIPFLFALFRALRPRTYVDLGVHYGASLIAAATASRTYGTDTHCVGVDTWEGDEHAGKYAGDRIYEELDHYTRGVFGNVTLMRSYFIEARKAFRPGSIDILHVDGLHTYEAVKEDFSTWFHLMAPSSVVMFHDIAVHRDGFGVHRLWDELKQHFPSMEFHHSHGLGVLFLGPEDERFAPFLRLIKDARAMRGYQALVEDIGGIIEERMAGFAPPQAPVQAGQVTLPPPGTPGEVAALHAAVAQQKAMLDAMANSTSWRVTAPLRYLRTRLGR